jgi:hypothetical protein
MALPYGRASDKIRNDPYRVITSGESVMSRFAHLLIAAVLATGLAFGLGAPIAQSQTEAPPAADTPAKGKKGLTADEKAKLKEERAAKKKAVEDKRAAKKAKRQDCLAQGKQDNLKGPKLREFMKTCTAG